ncbi:unnamed protein product [Spirodela intermedia]|uniref:Uncharacterized protein n=1 Tax=Spirodela intermedia TaxID=51605 RepID=A0A7I8ILV7_SPIIN|nr:unnamed protein product [Spirodela intermedia]CAA6657951.1 unnamed protein product [Spirodela intermedia]
MPPRTRGGVAGGREEVHPSGEAETRSDSEFDLEAYSQNLAEQSARAVEKGEIRTDFEGVVAHVPVMLGEVLQVFHGRRLRSFVDCTVGAGGHSSAIIRAHPDLQFYLGLDVDTTALETARDRIDAAIEDARCASEMEHSRLEAHLRLHLSLDGILMDLGMSSMQVNNPRRGFSVLGDGPLDMRMNPQAALKAEDILNSWPEAEVGRVLKEYGEESNWRLLQKKIMSARLHGGLHSTKELADLVRSTSPKSKGRQGWIKTATRVFQALRIAVNDELKTLEDALYGSFECLSSGGRLAVISFHSLEDRIVKQTFLCIINKEEGVKSSAEEEVAENWSKARVVGKEGIILTKRPITPTEEEEKLNVRCRSAKLRVIQKI